jgi:lysozyme
LIDPRLLDDLRRAEGLRLDAYLDGGGVPTIGYGHTGPDVYIGQTITAAQALDLLSADAEVHAAQAATLPEWPQLNTPCRQNAVIECVYNLGLEHWRTEFPATRAALLGQHWQAAHDELLESPLWIEQVGPGRVTRLAQYLLTGSYPASI